MTLHPFRSVPSLALFSILCLVAAAAPRSAAALSNSEARLALHLVSPTTKNACSRAAALPACASTVTAGGLYPTLHFAYLLVQNGDPVAGIAGLQCGIRYNGATHAGVDIFSWTNCATLEFSSGGWPASNSGNLITWDSTVRCQRTEPGGAGTGVVATAGYFYLAAYSPDFLEVLPRPIDGLARVADCASVEYTLEGGGTHHDPSYLGLAAFSSGASTPGYNPCVVLPPGPIDCTISGASSVVAGSAGNVYSASMAPSGASFLWSITGDGAISGSNTGPSVSVMAGAAGGFQLSLDVSYLGVTESCQKSVTVTASPQTTCSISGPAAVLEGSTFNFYTVEVTGPFTSRAWSITGDGVIVSNTALPFVNVTAGSPGGFEVTCVVQIPGGTSTSCSYAVSVDPTNSGCPIMGPASVMGLSQSVLYAAGATAPGTTFLWSISGNGSINGSNADSTVSVNAGPSGSFTLTLATTRSGLSHSCSSTISIIPGGGGGGSNANAKIMFHLQSPTTKNACTRTTALPACNAVISMGNLYPTLYYAYLLIQDASAVGGVSGLQCGINYNGATNAGVDVFSWHLCADLEFRSTGWPAAGGGNLITWDAVNHCQRFVPAGNDVQNGVVAAAGYFYLAAYTPDVMSVMPRPVDGKAKVSDCAATEYLIGGVGYPSGVPSHLGKASFGQAGNYNPCGILAPVERTTWSAIKGQYGDGGAAKGRRKP